MLTIENKDGYFEKCTKMFATVQHGFKIAKYDNATKYIFYL